MQTFKPVFRVHDHRQSLQRIGVVYWDLYQAGLGVSCFLSLMVQVHASRLSIIVENFSILISMTSGYVSQVSRIAGTQTNIIISASPAWLFSDIWVEEFWVGKSQYNWVLFLVIVERAVFKNKFSIIMESVFVQIIVDSNVKGVDCSLPCMCKGGSMKDKSKALNSDKVAAALLCDTIALQSLWSKEEQFSLSTTFHFSLWLLLDSN